MHRGGELRQYFVKRVAEGIITMWVVTLLVFLMLRITGNPIDILSAPDFSQADRERLKKVYGLDKPWWEQYLFFNKSIFTGDFGESLAFDNRDAFDMFVSRVPATLQLAGAALIFALVTGVTVGVISAARPDSIFDRVGKVLAISGQAIPSFWLGLLFILLFSVHLGWLPSVGGIDRVGYKGLIMPAISLGWGLVAAHMRIVRSSMLEALDSEYVKMLRAKGVPRQIVIWKHALRNASIPVFTLFFVSFAHLISGAVITETIFAWPGVGRLMVEAIFGRDYATVQVTVFFLAAAIVAINVFVDVMYAWLDPRVRVA
jgi:peptide/nickel transport system permease protein